jgi:hypothetical protein
VFRHGLTAEEGIKGKREKGTLKRQESLMCTETETETEAEAEA